MTYVEAMQNFEALTQPQLEALANVAFGGRGGGCSPRTLAVLERKGLIARVECAEGNFRWTEWEMDIGVHLAFCGYCASIS